MQIPGTLSIKVDEEQLDEIVIMHCQKAVELCTDIFELERQAMARTNGDKALLHLQNIMDYVNYINALNTVIQYFGGQPIYTLEDESAGVHDETIDGSKRL